MTDALLEVENLEAGYGEVQVLWGLSLKARRGKLTAIVGANGAGKTTTLRAVAGTIAPWRGKIIFEGEDVTRLTTHAKAERGFSLVPEGRQLFSMMSVAENLELGAFSPRGSRSYAERLEQVFKLFPRLAERARQRAGTLSGGEQQMVAIARGLMSRPKLVMFDEPSLGLAPNIVERTFEIIDGIRKAGTTVLMVEQNALAALEMCDHAYLLESGSLALSGTGRELVDNPHVRNAYLAG